MLTKHYDKLLHILGTFTAMIWLLRIPGIRGDQAFGIVFFLQLLKTYINYRDTEYSHWGDWVANLGGYILAILWYL